MEVKKAAFPQVGAILEARPEQLDQGAAQMRARTPTKSQVVGSETKQVTDMTRSPKTLPRSKARVDQAQSMK